MNTPAAFAVIVAIITAAAAAFWSESTVEIFKEHLHVQEIIKSLTETPSGNQ